jgi:beta-N-acetylhexosaminidase
LQAVIWPQEALREKIAQMVMTGFDGTTVSDSLLYDLSKRNLGGVVIMGNNIISPAQLAALAGNIKKASPQLPFIATDQEGGKVARLNESNGFEDTYTAYQLGSVFNSEDSTRKMASKMAQWLALSGINTNFAPVADVNVYPQSPAIGKYGRSFSQSPQLVSRFDSYFIDEMHKKNVLTTLKHFPGHGSALQDSHLGFTDITATWADSELVPYKNLFDKGYADLVMAGHLYNSKLDSLYPATLSYSVISGLLRKQLGFKGVVITDDMLMKGITNNYSFETGIELAINAGVDILLFASGARNGGSMLRQVVDVVADKVASGKIAESRINESYSRIIALKQKLSNASLAEDEDKPTVQPADFSLDAYPNPFNPNTKIVVKIKKHSFISLKVYNLIGQIAASLESSYLPAGEFSYIFSGANLASGIYLVRMETPTGALSKKIALIK